MFRLIAPEEAPKPRRRWSGILKDIEAFVASDGDACELAVPDGYSAQTIYNTYFQTVKRHEIPVTVMRRKNRVYIVKGTHQRGVL